MNLFYRMASKLPSYLRRFGLIPGLRLLSTIERRRSPKSLEIIYYKVPGYPKPIALRNQVSDHATFWQCIVQCQYDISAFPQSKRLITKYRDLLERGERPLIIDCGANVGLASLWFARQFPEAIIYAIEPDISNFMVLKKNISGRDEQVMALQGAVWPNPGMVRIINPDSGSAAFRVDSANSSDSNNVRAYTIDQICSMAATSEPFIVKIDIEGGQGYLFSENIDWVGRAHLIALELDDWLLPWQGTSRPFFASMSKYPFDYLIKGETIFCFRDFDPR